MKTSMKRKYSGISTSYFACKENLQRLEKKEYTCQVKNRIENLKTRMRKLLLHEI